MDISGGEHHMEVDESFTFVSAPANEKRLDMALPLKTSAALQLQKENCHEGMEGTVGAACATEWKKGCDKTKESKEHDESDEMPDVYDEEYEVEKILDVKEDNAGNRSFFVKWKGWANKHNTWEPEKHLVNCEKKLEVFLDRKEKALLRERKQAEKLEAVRPSKAEVEDFYKAMRIQGNTVSTIITRCKLAVRSPYKGKRPSTAKKYFLNNAVLSAIQQHRKDMTAWTEELNSLSKKAGEAAINIENRVDFAAAPEDFTYITSSIPGPGVIIPTEPVVSCECVQCGSNDSTCCPGIGILGDPVNFPYLPDGRLKQMDTKPLYECNKKCRCGPECPNRVVQKGRQVPLTIFRTRDKGWGVKADIPIHARQFVTEYVGEIITEEEAERRGELYDSLGTTYLFDLDYAMDSVHVIDAAKFGNISHFFNHSCSPNLGVKITYVNCMDVSIPHVAFFALRYIRKGEELCFDYNPPKLDGSVNSKDTRFSAPCRCGSDNCRKLLPL